jgi:hypothetical protein
MNNWQQVALKITGPPAVVIVTDPTKIHAFSVAVPELKPLGMGAAFEFRYVAPPASIAEETVLLASEQIVLPSLPRTWNGFVTAPTAPLGALRYRTK